ncbi:MAG: antibiotic biosynthesis monooxygenase [Propionibacteriaceae bacterium]|jgi:quinol monooxygenase YgiN|nr:antibiotic biosynthesis monooxygenase [Propionibacteriaceae bacterium]
MIFIVVKYSVKPEAADKWLSAVSEFTQATRQEPGNKWFEWYKSVEEPNTFLLVEGFEDDAGAAHVNSEHFPKGLAAMKPLLAKTPSIVSQSLPGKSDWDLMGELVIE